MSMLKEFRDFAIKGNVVDLAIGVIIGAAFGTIVSSLVDDVFMPVIGLTRVLPQVLAETRRLLAEAWAGDTTSRGA